MMVSQLNIFYMFSVLNILVSLDLIGYQREFLRIGILLFLIIIFFFNNKLNLKKFGYIIIFDTIAIILLMLTKNKDILTYIYLFTFSFFLERHREEKVEKYMLLSLISFFLMYLILYLKKDLTLIEIEYRNRIFFLYKNRELAVGPPYLGNLLYSISTLLYLKYSNKISASIGGIILILGYLTFNTRGPILFYLILLISVYILKKTIKLKIINYLLKNIFVYFSILSVFIPIVFIKNTTLNKIFSNRIQYWYMLIIERGWKGIFLFESVKKLDHSDFIIDNSYLHIIFGGGILIFGLLCYIFNKSLTNMIKLKKINSLAFFISYLSYCYFESIFLRGDLVITIYFWYLLFKNFKFGENDGKNFINIS